MKKYVFEVIIEEGNDEFWESLKGPGIDEVTEVVKDCLAAQGFDHSNSFVKLTEFHLTVDPKDLDDES